MPFGDDEAVLAAFRERGVVVVSGVLDDAEVDRGLEELWTSPRLLGRDPAVRRDEEGTWSRDHWPQEDGGKNFLSSLDGSFDRTNWELVQHPKVVHILHLLYGGPVVHSGSGRWGVMRPTQSHPEWRTDESWLHWDQNPWREPEFTYVQCFACFTDQSSSSGGLLCVPGFHRRWHEWGVAHPEGSVLDTHGRRMTQFHGRGNPFLVPDDDSIQAHVVRVLAPRGSLVLWDGRLPHQNYPNRGHDFRVIHYLDYIRALPTEVEERRRMMERKLVVWSVLERDADAFFPASLSLLGREVTCTPEVWPEQADDKLRRAILLAAEGGEDELSGKLEESCDKFRRAEKLFGDDAREWMDAVFCDS